MSTTPAPDDDGAVTPHPRHDPSDACPNDPDGQHYVGCGCDVPDDSTKDWVSFAVDAPAPPPEATFDSFREAVAWVYGQVRVGTMWVGWAPDGRFAYGDRDNPPIDGVTLVDPAVDAIEAAALAGAAAQNIVNRAIAQQREQMQSRLVQPNRAARRAASRGNGSTPPGGGLILPR